MKIWNIRDYGACTSDRLQTEKIQKAIDDCYLAGGGRVVVPCGVFLTGDIRLRSHVELYLESGAILMGSRDPAEYFHYRSDSLQPVEIEKIGDTAKTCRSSVSTSAWSNGLIRAFDAEDIAVIGEKGSYIDGCNCYDPEGENNYRGPHGMSFWRCRNIRLEGYTFFNSGNWCHAIFQSRDILVRGISVYGGHDGVDLRTCDNATIEHCTFNTGDDAVAGFDNNDVIVRDSVLNSSCMPVRFGGNNVRIENCVSGESAFGFRLRLTDEEKISGAITNETNRHEASTAFSYYCDNRADLRKPAENMVFSNCHFASARELMRLEFDGLHRWCCNRSLRSVTFENCSVAQIKQAGMVWGDADEKVTVIFKNVKLSCRKGFESAPIFVAANFDRIVFEDCVFEGWHEPTILVATDDPVEVIRSTPLKVQKATQEECHRAHPTGLASQDVGKNLRFK